MPFRITHHHMVLRLTLLLKSHIKRRRRILHQEVVNIYSFRIIQRVINLNRISGEIKLGLTLLLANNVVPNINGNTNALTEAQAKGKQKGLYMLSLKFQIYVVFKLSND